MTRGQFHGAVRRLWLNCRIRSGDWMAPLRHIPDDTPLVVGTVRKDHVNSRSGS